MTDAPGYTIETTDWKHDQKAIQLIRRRVFIEEQQVPEELEWDDADTSCLHLLARLTDGSVVATARLLDTGQIGRMAVLAEWRGRGIGSALLNELLRLAKQRRLQRVFLNAQAHAVSFYHGFGFREYGDSFNEAGIPHRKMRMDLEPTMKM